MKVVQHCVYFPPEVGGLESHVYYLCRGLAARGHEVTMVTSRSEPGLAREERMEGIRVRRTWFPSRTPSGWIAHALASVPVTVGEARGADVVHAQTFASAVPIMAAAKGRRLPLVLTLHTSHFLRRAESPLWRPILRRLVRSADRVLATSVEIRDVAGGLAPELEVEAVTNGVETDFFRPVEPAIPPGDGPTLVVPRRLFEKNGVEYLVRAMPRIVRETGARAIVVGDGPERERLEALSRELGVAERVWFTGARPHREMPGLLSSGDVAVFPSLMEATSVAALEAMACRIPVAASRVGGLPEIVDEEVGTLFAPADAGALAGAVISLLEGGALDARGRRARERVVERWSNDRLVERHLEVYAELAGRRVGTTGKDEG